jgi:hypothetical protein
MILASFLTLTRFEAPAIPRSSDPASQTTPTSSVREPEIVSLPSGEVSTPENPPLPPNEQPSPSAPPPTAPPGVPELAASELKRKRDAFSDADAQSATPEKRPKVANSVQPIEHAVTFDSPRMLVDLDLPTEIFPRDVFEPASERTDSSYDFDAAEDYDDDGDAADDADCLVFEHAGPSAAAAPLPESDVLTYPSLSSSSIVAGAQDARRTPPASLVKPAHSSAQPSCAPPPLPNPETPQLPLVREDTDPQALPPLLRLGSHVIGGTSPDEMDMELSSPVVTPGDGMPDLLARIEMLEEGNCDAVELVETDFANRLAHSAVQAEYVVPTDVGKHTVVSEEHAAVHVVPIDVGNHTAVSEEDAKTQQVSLDLTLDISTAPTTPIVSGLSISDDLSLAPRETTAACLPTPLPSSRATSLARTTRATSTPGDSASAATTPHKFIDLASKERQSPRPERRARELHELLSQKAREWERKWDERERSLDERARVWEEQCAAQAQLVADLSQAWDDRELLWEARLKEQERRYEEERQCWEVRLAEVERRQEEDRSLHDEAEQTLASRLGGIEEQLQRVRAVAAAAGRMLQDT